MALTLTEEQLFELQESFAIFDKNGDGTITPGELVTLLKSMNKSITDREVTCMIDKMDRDGNGKIDFREFCDHCREFRKTEEQLARAFRDFDLDGNGYITESELCTGVHRRSTVMKRLGQSLSSEQIKLMIRSADRDGDGRVSYKEFLRLMTKK